MEALEVVARYRDLPVIWDPCGYGLRRWLRSLNGADTPQVRCSVCYEMRLTATAAMAREHGFSAFSTTLFYSRYQRHDLIRDLGKTIATDHGLDFVYHDFRQGWEKGIEEARALGLYRQPYCGCMYSEEERYDRRAKRRKQGPLASPA